VIDTKRYRGRVESRDVGGWLTSDLQLFVAGRNRSKLLAGMARQAEAVRRSLAGTPESASVPVTPVIVFVSDDNWSLFSRPLRFGDVHVVWGKKLGEMIRARGPVDTTTIMRLEEAITRALPAA